MAENEIYTQKQKRKKQKEAEMRLKKAREKAEDAGNVVAPGFLQRIKAREKQLQDI